MTNLNCLVARCGSWWWRAEMQWQYLLPFSSNSVLNVPVPKDTGQSVRPHTCGDHMTVPVTAGGLGFNYPCGDIRTTSLSSLLCVGTHCGGLSLCAFLWSFPRSPPPPLTAPASRRKDRDMCCGPPLLHFLLGPRLDLAQVYRRNSWSQTYSTYS